MLQTQDHTPLSNNGNTEETTVPTPRQEQSRSGEEAVRRAAEAVINRSSSRSGTGDENEKRVRRRSRRPRRTPIITGTGLHFHYGVGILMLFTLIAVIFNEQISKIAWKILHPPAPPVPSTGAAGAGAAAAAPSGPAPWWFHVEIPALLIGFGIWLYLTPGVWDSVKTSLGLNKNKERRSRKRHT